jgi:hypothetical protein
MVGGGGPLSGIRIALAKEGPIVGQQNPWRPARSGPIFVDANA